MIYVLQDRGRHEHRCQAASIVTLPSEVTSDKSQLSAIIAMKTVVAVIRLS